MDPVTFKDLTPFLKEVMLKQTLIQGPGEIDECRYFELRCESSKSYNKAGLILDLTDDIDGVETIYKYEFFILVTKPFINEDRIKPYCQHIWHTLEYSNMHIKSLQKHLQDIYGLVENKEAQHSVDKAKKIIRDSLTEIESAMGFLDKKVKSMP